jgi:NAD(P)-dependent dehydrogenase (short-subunit alcohol dehydrogenase family)
MNSVESQPLIVVITGVTRGLGRAMVDEFAKLGHTVLGCARTRNEIDVLSCLYPSHDFQVVDVGSDTAVAAWAEQIIDKYGAPD